jgi:uncharacterized coiled-coil protein SlyX
MSHPTDPSTNETASITEMPPPQTSSARITQLENELAESKTQIDSLNKVIEEKNATIKKNNLLTAITNAENVSKTWEGIVAETEAKAQKDREVWEGIVAEARAMVGDAGDDGDVGDDVNAGEDGGTGEE